MSVIPVKVRDLVLKRDHFRCVINGPGCQGVATVAQYPISNESSIELERPQTECGNTRRGLTLNQGLVDWRAPVESTRPCSVSECDRPHYGRSYCRLHYDRWYSNGDPNVRRVLVGATVGERIAHYTRRDGDCILWTGRVSRDGYGQMQVEGRPKRTHRVSYELAVGPIPEGALLRHTCDVKLCVNPEHLIPGTSAENSADAVARGRMAVGERNGDARITNAQAISIFQRAKRGEKQYRLAAEFGIGQATVSRIVRGENWSTITGANRDS